MFTNRLNFALIKFQKENSDFELLVYMVYMSNMRIPIRIINISDFARRSGEKKSVENLIYEENDID